MLTLTFLGVGSAFAKRNFQSNALVEAWSVGPHAQDAPDDNLLIDFGATGPLALHHLKDQPGFGYLNDAGRIRYDAIRNVFITHLHGDHVGGLEELAVIMRYRNTAARPRLHIERALIDPLWENCLKGGLGVHADGVAKLEDYFELQPLDGRTGKDAFRLLDRYEFASVPTDHIRIRSRYDWSSFGLQMRDRQSGQSAFFSGDTRFDPDLLTAALASVAIMFHEVQLEEDPKPVHATLPQLLTLPAKDRKKIILYHFSDAWDEPRFAGVAAEFAGFASPWVRYTVFQG